jgi:UDP-N-acetylenolpyruvoylglucosamine reductase
MIVRNNIPVYDICWLNHARGGMIGTFYEPENLDELKNICSKLYLEGKDFDLIGHTSNIYFLPDYSVANMVSTRKCNNIVEETNYIVCDCGVPVAKLSRQMVEEGVKGFEGLIDLPGTVGAAIYGNASCYRCSINSLLISFELLKPDGDIVTVYPNDLKLSKRSSSLKRHELKGIILSVKLKKEQGDAIMLKELAEKNHHSRKVSQPSPKDNLGSIYASKQKKTPTGLIVLGIAKFFGLLYGLTGKNYRQVRDKQKETVLSLLQARELLPYVYGWNRYIWKDEQAHTLFWKFDKIHRLLYKSSEFEIEIKRKK